MQSTDITVLNKAHQWLQTGETVWLVTVLSTYGSSPRQPGAMCAINQQGLIVGSVSGGCIEDDLRDKINAGEFNADTLFFHVYGESLEDRDRFRLPCGGTLRLVIEKLTESSWLEEVLASLNIREQVKRTVFHNGQSLIEPVSVPGSEIVETSQQLSFVYGPRQRLLIIGAGETSTYLASMATALDYKVYVADPREDMQLQWDESNGELMPMMPDDAVLELNPDQQTSIITLTHDPKLDDMALLEALKTDAFFVGSLGSKRTNAKRRERLALFDLTPQQIARLHGPVGLEIGSKTPAEIAVSILAQLVQLNAERKKSAPQVEIRAVSNG
jgi:xanthine dehydrogenase accessory factor